MRQRWRQDLIADNERNRCAGSARPTEIAAGNDLAVQLRGLGDGLVADLGRPEEAFWKKLQLLLEEPDDQDETL